MDYLKPLSILVIPACLVGGTYYTVIEIETNGAIVVLLGILYFSGVPRIVGEYLQTLGLSARPM